MKKLIMVLACILSWTALSNGKFEMGPCQFCNGTGKMGYRYTNPHYIEPAPCKWCKGAGVDYNYVLPTPDKLPAGEYKDSKERWKLNMRYLETMEVVTVCPKCNGDKVVDKKRCRYCQGFGKCRRKAYLLFYDELDWRIEGWR
jgi:RecJ-like exonuclease